MTVAPRPRSEPGLASPNTGSGAYESWREKFVRPMMLGALGLGLIALILGLATNQGTVQNSIFVLSYLLLVAVTFLPAPYWLRIGTFLVAIYALAVSELVSTGILGDSVLFFMALVIFAALMLSSRAGAVSLGVSLFSIAVVGVLVETGVLTLLNPSAMKAQLADWFSTSATMSLFAVTFILGLRQLQKEFRSAQSTSADAMQALEGERASLEGQVEDRTVQLTAVNEVARVANSILNPQELSARVVNLITEQFGYYYAALFVLDEAGEQAVLQSATGEAGRVLKENKHHLRVGGNSMVGMAISTVHARVALDVGSEPVRFENPLLPYTRSEIALPLVIGGRILGALDVQSTKAGAFGPQEIETLQGMANQVAIAFENARLFENSRKSVEELQSIQRQYVADAWKPYASQERLEYAVGEDEPGGNSRQLEVPLAIRDEVIGQINLAGESDWSPEQRALIETVADQAALALENARLVEQSQAAARREHQVANITARLWTTPTVQGILQTAVNELTQALDLSEAKIELRMESGDE